MAKIKARKEVDFEAPFEPSSVTVQARDTFYTPATPYVDPSISELANSLSGIIPSLRKYSIQKDVEDKELNTAEAIEAFRNNNMKSFKDAVKSGKIKEGANPYFVEAYVQQELIHKSNLFKDELYKAYIDEGVVNNTAPNAFEEFFARKSSEFRDIHKLDTYSSSDVATGFVNNAEAARSSLFERHINQRMDIISSANRTLLADNIVSAVEKNIDSSGEFDVIGLAANLNVASKELIKKGMNGQDVNRIIIEQITLQAEILENTEILEVLDYAKAGTSNLSGTAYAVELIEKAENNILLKEIRKENHKNSKSDRVKRELQENQINDAMAFINETATVDVNNDGQINILDGIVEFDVEKYLRDNDIKDAKVIQSIYSVTGTIISAQSNVIEDEEYINDILLAMNVNINDENLQQQILDGMGEKYSVSRGMQLWSDYNRKRQLGDHVFLSSKSFANLTSSLRTAIKKEGYFTEDIAKSEIAVFELNDFALDWLSDNPQGTKAEFKNAVRQEWKDILATYVGNKTFQEVEEFEDSLSNDAAQLSETSNNDDAVNGSTPTDEKNPFNEKEDFNKENEISKKQQERASLVVEVQSVQAELSRIDTEISKINSSPSKNETAKNALLMPLEQQKQFFEAELIDLKKQLKEYN